MHMKIPPPSFVYYVSLIVLSGVFVYGYIDIKKENRELVSIVQSLIVAGQHDLSMTQAELDTLRTENQTLAHNKELELAAQNEKLNELSGRLSALQSAPQELTTTDIVHEWKDSVFKITCTFTNQTLQKRYTQTGSGLGFNLKNGAIFMTNRHVLTRNDGAHIDGCTISRDGVVEFDLPLADVRLDTQLDFAFTLFSQTQTIFDKTLETGSVCKALDVVQGENIVILGYPITGVKDSVTVTEGIISGLEPDYYVTSAKIEQGNSGGGAILTSGNCILGLPTYAQVGQVESLARILKLEKLIDL